MVICMTIKTCTLARAILQLLRLVIVTDVIYLVIVRLTIGKTSVKVMELIKILHQMSKSRVEYEASCPMCSVKFTVDPYRRRRRPWSHP